MKTILAIETATEACSAALWRDGAVTDRREEAPNRHAEVLAPMVAELLAEAGLGATGLDGIALSRGPGGFTGLRVGAALVQGLAWGADLPVAAVSSLRVLAHGAPRRGARVLAAFDARMHQVYWGLFGDCGEATRALGAERVSAPAGIELPAGEWLALGSGIDAYRDELPEAVRAVRVADARPRARDLAALAAGLPASAWGAADDALPVYVRDAVVQEPG